MAHHWKPGRDEARQLRKAGYDGLFFPGECACKVDDLSAAVSRPSTVGVLPLGIRRSRAQANVYLGRLRCADEATEATHETKHVSDEAGECESEGCGHAGRLRAGVLRGESMIGRRQSSEGGA